jgi:hypothetical protein
MTDDLCGYDAPGGPCQNPATEGDRCWIPSHSDPGAENPQGRKFAISESDHDDILDAARNGLSKAGCARAAGVDKASLLRYLEAHPEFRTAFARARERGELSLVRDGLRDPDTDSSMAKFLLSTSFNYIKTEKRELEHSGEGGGPLEIRREVVDTAEDDGDD